MIKISLCVHMVICPLTNFFLYEYAWQKYCNPVYVIVMLIDEIWRHSSNRYGLWNLKQWFENLQEKRKAFQQNMLLQEQWESWVVPSFKVRRHYLFLWVTCDNCCFNQSKLNLHDCCSLIGLVTRSLYRSKSGNLNFTYLEQCTHKNLKPILIIMSYIIVVFTGAWWVMDPTEEDLPGGGIG